MTEAGVGGADGGALRDDRALLAAHVTGDPDAFAELVRRHQNRLWAVALRTTGNREDAADAVQEALVSAYRNAASYRGRRGRHDLAAPHRRQRQPRPAAAARRPARRPAPRRRRPDPRAGRRDGGPGDLAGGAGGPGHPAARAAGRSRARRRPGLLRRGRRPGARLRPGTVKSRCFRGRARLAPLLAHLRQPTSGNQSGDGDVPPPDVPDRPPTQLGGGDRA